MSALWWVLGSFALLEIGGNLAILVAHRRARRRSPPTRAAWGGDTKNTHETSTRLWRSGRPSPGTYSAAAAAGAVEVIDLRAEGGDGPDADLGLEYVRLPMRDGQAPDEKTLDRFLDEVAASPGTVLAHCSAGVGRTGSMVAAWQVIEDGMASTVALGYMLSVGPPSLEQIDFVRGLPMRRRPRIAALIVSRVLDAPRRTWSRLRALFHRR